MAGKFELYKDTAGKHRFRLRASNGQIIASGEAYESRASALKGIESVRKNAPDAASWPLRQVVNGAHAPRHDRPRRVLGEVP